VEIDYVQQRTAHRGDALLPPWHRACFLPIVGSSCTPPGESR
jgi:hypothetical protein